MANLKNIKKGDTVILHMFTGLATGVKKVIAADKETFTVETNKGDMVFSKKTGKQIDPEPSSEKYANFATEDDGSFVPKNKKSSKEEKPAKKKAKKQPEPEEDEEIDEDEYEDADGE